MGNLETSGVFQPEFAAIDVYESLEGMLVAIPKALDHLLVSPMLLDALVPAGFDIVHVTTEYSEQVSDLDPLVARIDLLEP